MKYTSGQILDCRRSGRPTSRLNKLVGLHHMVIYPSIWGRPRYLTKKPVSDLFSSQRFVFCLVYSPSSELERY